MNIQEINISSIQTVENSRLVIKNLEGIMQNIQNNGLIHPIKVCKTKGTDFIIVSGNRRLAACKKLGWKTIPANVVEDMDLAELLIQNSAENLHREDITPMELGRICDRLKKQGLNISEIEARLNYPKSKITHALDMYHNLPDKYRGKVAYHANTQKKDGSISASCAAKIVALKRSFGLSDASTEKLMTIAKMDEMTVSELNLINIFLKQGLSVAQSLEKRQHYASTRVDVFVDRQEMEKLLTKYRMDSAIQLLSAIIYGEIPPIKKPDFVELKQIPFKPNDKKNGYNDNKCLKNKKTLNRFPGK